jgi:hypothetical protein
MGTLQLLVATAVVTAAAWLLAWRALGERAGAALRGVGTGVLTHALILVPTWSLGAAEALTRGRVQGAVVAFAAISAALAVGGRAREAWACLRADLAAVRLTFCRARREHWAVVGLTVIGAIIAAWYGVTVWLCAPSGEGDAVFYHEPIVALTLQHGSLGPFDLPRGLQRVNGMPRFINLLQLWFATFTGRSHMELATVGWVPFGMVAMFQLARTAGGRVGHAWLLALLWAMVPGMLRLSAGILVDVPSAAITTAALALVVAPPRRGAGVLLAAVAIGLVCGTKYHLVTAAAALGLGLGLNVMVRGRGSIGRRLGLVAMAGAVVVGALALTLAWNHHHYDNPVWPAGVKLPSLDIDFPSANKDLRDALTSGTAIERSEVWSRWFSAPFSRGAWGGSGARPEDYGPAVRYVFWPLGLIGAAGAALQALVCLVRRRRRAFVKLAPVLVAAALLAAAYAGFPSVVRGRYWLPVVSAMMLLTVWLLRRRAEVLDALVTTAVVLTLIAIPWSYQQKLLPQWDDFWAAWEVAPEERAWVGRRGTHIVPKAGQARVRDLTAGKRVGFFRYVQPLGLLWNDDYSNEVYWLGPAATAPQRAIDLDIHWLILRQPGVQRVGFPRGVYEKVSHLQLRKGQRPFVVYRRRDDAPEVITLPPPVKDDAGPRPEAMKAGRAAPDGPVLYVPRLISPVLLGPDPATSGGPGPLREGPMLDGSDVSGSVFDATKKHPSLRRVMQGQP